MSTYTAKPGDITKKWVLIDATDLVVPAHRRVPSAAQGTPKERLSASGLSREPDHDVPPRDPVEVSPAHIVKVYDELLIARGNAYHGLQGFQWRRRCEESGF